METAPNQLVILQLLNSFFKTPATPDSFPIQQMSHFCALGLEVAGVMGVGLRFDGKLFDDVQAVSFEADHLFRIVGEKADAANTEIDQNLGSGAVLPEIHRKTQFLVCFDRIEALFLKFVGSNFGG